MPGSDSQGRPVPLYDGIGSTYGATRRADLRIARDLARLVDARPGARFLDLACGTGNYTQALAALGGAWSGVDISEVMLAQAAAKTGARIEWKLGSAAELPFETGTFDGVVCSLAIHHFPDLRGPFREVHRVVRRGAFVIFTAFPEQMRGYWLNHYFPEMLRRSVEAMPGRRSVLSALADSGLRPQATIPFRVASDLEDLFLYAGKERPELYLDPRVRANISSFASLCAAEELEAGLRALREDLGSGRFAAVAASYSTPSGDYAYVVSRKDGRARAG